MILQNFKSISWSSFKKNYLFILLVIFLTLFKHLTYLFYNINESPDFKKYLVYIEHFFSNNTTNHEHGLLYYYLHSLHLNFFFSNQINNEIALHKSIIDMNFYLFLIGLLGIYKLLQLFNFSNKSIYFALIFLNFFPPAIALRMVLKPEILAFSLLPWIIYFLEKFKKTNNKIYLTLLIPLLVSCITQKGNILVIICIFLLVSNYKVFYKLKLSDIAILGFFFVVLFSLITIENNKVNGKNILDIQSGSELERNYDYKAPKSTIYKINLYELFSSPIKHRHAESFIAITLLETNGDYFDLFWDNDATQFFKSRKNIFNFEQSNEIKAPFINFENSTITIYQQRSTDIYLRQTLSLILSIIFFTSLLGLLLRKSDHKIYLASVFFGMGIILIHVITGYPKNNFDPLVGDTFKPLYYSFVLLLSAAFLIAKLSQENRFKFKHLLLYSLIIFFILGFPKNENLQIDNFFIEKIENSNFCEIDKNFLLEGSFKSTTKCTKKLENSLNSNYENNMFFHKPFNFMMLIFNTLVLLFAVFEKKLFLLRSKI